MRATISEKTGEIFTLEIKRGSKTDAFIVQPLAEMNAALNDPESPEYDLLILANRQGEDFVLHPPLTALYEAVEETYAMTRGTLEALGQMVVGTRSAKELGGLIRIGALAGDMAQRGIIAVILFMALLSINLGLINLFPIPLLDGGHLVFYAFEALLGKPVPEQIQEYAFRFGLAFLVCVMVFANLNDIMQLIL